MVVLALVALVLAARGGNSQDIKTGQQPIVVCSNPPRLYPDPNNCRKFIRCVNRKPLSMSCPAKTVFDPAMQICIWREDINNCTSEQHGVDPGNIRRPNLTPNIRAHDYQNGATESTQSRGILNRSNLHPTAYFSTAASSKQNIGKTEMSFSVNKIHNAIDEYMKPRSGHPTTSNEYMKPISGHPTTSNEYMKPISGHPTTSNEYMKPISGHPTTSNEYMKPRSGHPTTSNEYMKPRSGHSTTSNEYMKPRSGHSTTSNEYMKPRSGHPTTSNEYMKPRSGHPTTSNEYMKPRSGHPTTSNEYMKPRSGHTTTSNEYMKPRSGHPTTSNEYMKPRSGHPTTSDEYMKPRSGHTTTSNAVGVGSVARTLHPNHQNGDLYSASMATVSVRPTNMATHPTVIPEPGNKWYQTMNSEATTAITSTLYSGRSQTMSTASNQGYQTQQNAIHLMDNSDRKLKRNRNIEPKDGFIKQHPTDGANKGKLLKHDVLDNAKQNMSNGILGSITHLRNGSGLENKTERSGDNKDGRGERTQGFTSISVDDAKNSTSETDNNELVDAFGEEENNTDVSAWVGHVSKDVVEGKRSPQTPDTPSLHSDIQLSMEPSNILENTTSIARNVIAHVSRNDVSRNDVSRNDVSRNDVEQTTTPTQMSDIYFVPHESLHALAETTRPSQTAHGYLSDKAVTIHQAAYNDTNLSEADNISANNISFEDVAKLIQPFRVRLDRPSNKQTPENPGDDIAASPAESEENLISQEETWTRDEVELLPSLIEHLTAKIVNRDLLVPGVTSKSRWYDRKHEAFVSERTTTPHPDNTDNSRANRAEPGQHLRTVKDHLLTASSTALSKSSVGNSSEPQRARDEQSTHQTHTDVLTPATKRPSAAETTTRKLISTGEPSVGALPGLPLSGTGEVTPARSISAPYQVTGLARPFRCPEASGHFPDVTNCAAYYQCLRGQAVRRECAPGQVFHASVQSCVPSSLVPPCTSAYADAVQEDESFARSVCRDPNGLYKDNVSCAHFFECTNGWPIRRQCMMGTVFDDVMRRCSWSKFVPGCEHQTTPEIEINTSGTGQTNFLCPRDGYFRDPQRCDVYYLCAGNQALRMTCNTGTSFDVTLNMCVWSHLVDDCRNKKGQLQGDWENTVASMTIPKSYTPANVELDTRESPQQEFQCPEKNGVFPSQENCGVYYVCADGIGQRMNCPEGLGYDVQSGLCLEAGQLPQCDLSSRLQAPREDTTPFSCPEAHGLYSDSSNCSFFIHCFKKAAYRHECQPGTVFSPANAACTWSQLVPECQNAGQDTLDISQSVNRKYSGQSKAGRRGVSADTYQQHVVEPTVYKVQPVDVQEFTCPDVEDGFFKDDVFCDIFHRCVVGKKFTFTCPTGTFFRLEETLCDFCEAVSGCTNDGIRLEALGTLPEAAALSQRPQQQIPDHFELSIVNIDADPTGCPASGGLFPHPRNCRQFVFCSRFVPLVLTCPEPLLFNSQTLTCDFAVKVHCFRPNDYRRK